MLNLRQMGYEIQRKSVTNMEDETTRDHSYTRQLKRIDKVQT